MTTAAEKLAPNAGNKIPFETLISVVNLCSGAIGVSFMHEDAEEANRVRSGTTGREHLNDRAAEHMLGALGGQWGLSSLFAPLFAQATREYMSSWKFKHCEIAFKLNEKGRQMFGPDRLLALSVEQESGVQIKARHFHSDYIWRWLRCDPKQMRAMLWHGYKTQGARFSASKMNRTVFNPGPEQRDSWFCTFHVMAALQFLDCPEFHMTRCNTHSIDELFHLVDNCNHRPDDMSSNIAPHELEQIYGRDKVHSVVYSAEKRARPQPTRSKRPKQKRNIAKQKQ